MSCKGLSILQEIVYGIRSMMTLNIPGEPFLPNILRLWQESPKRTLVRDLSDEHRKEHTVEEFLYDLSTVQQQIYSGLDEEVKKQLRDPDTDVFIGVLAGAGYGFVVLVFAIYCLGGVIVPLSPRVNPEEAKYFLQLCNAVLLTTTPAHEQNAQVICKIVGGIKTFMFDATQSQVPETVSFTLDTEIPPVNPKKGFVMLYTSGTTGSPKGVVHSRRSAAVGFSVQIEAFNLTPPQ